RRRLPRMPVRLGNELRSRQPLARPGGPRRPDPRRPRLHHMSPSPAARDAADWASRIAERLPPGDVRELSRAAAEGPDAVRSLRARTPAPVLREACDQLAARLVSSDRGYLAGLLAGAARAIERARQHQALSVVWTGPESGITTSRLTAATV